MPASSILQRRARNLLGQQAYTEAVGALGPGESALLIVIDRDFIRIAVRIGSETGSFERIAIVQGETRYVTAGRRLPLHQEARRRRCTRIQGGERLSATAGNRSSEAIAHRDHGLTANDERRREADDHCCSTTPCRNSCSPVIRDPEPLWREIWSKKRLETVHGRQPCLSC